MNYKFTLNNLLFELDTERKTLSCPNDVWLSTIKKNVDSCVGHILWGGYHALDAVMIKQPYQNIYEFSACLFYYLSEIQTEKPPLKYPTELYAFAPCYAPLYEGMKPCRLFNDEDMEYYEKEFDGMSGFAVY